jgi:hypothetical protein
VGDTLGTNRAVVTLTSGNMFFRLIQGSPIAGPRLSIQVTGTSVSVSWQTAGFKLQSRAALGAGAWADVSASSNPFSETAAGPARFYRLVNTP